MDLWLILFRFGLDLLQKLQGLRLFFSGEFFMNLELSVSDVEKLSDLSLHYIY